MAADVATSAVNGLTAWERIAKMVSAFGGGWQAVVAIGIIATAVAIIAIAALVVLYLTLRSNNETRIEMAKLVNRRPRRDQ